MNTTIFSETVIDISKIIGGQTGWHDNKRKLLEKSQRIFHAEAISVFLVRDRHVVLDGHVGYTKYNGRTLPDDELQANLTYKLTNPDGSQGFDGVTGWVASTGKEILLTAAAIPETTVHAGKPDALEIWHPTLRPFREMFAVPLKHGNETLGVLKVENKRDSSGEPGAFDIVDKKVMRALANLLSMAVSYSYYRALPYHKLLDTAITWLEIFGKRNLYQHLVEFTASLFQADVCALFVRRYDETKSSYVELAAGRLANGDAMDTQAFANSRDALYRIGEPYDGITGWVATTGRSFLANSCAELEAAPGHAGKWDALVWDGAPAQHFDKMMAVPLSVPGVGVVGVLKLEWDRRTANGARRPVNEEDLAILASAASGLAQHLHNFKPVIDYEYPLTRAQPGIFRRRELGQVILRHLATGICQSDLHYFLHAKDRRKLDRRLPMVLGHECACEVVAVGPNARYPDTGQKIRVGDRVFVIPLKPCFDPACKVCAGGFGDNYCPSVRFMGSNADGSLRSVFAYDACLLLKIDAAVETHIATFAEPVANVLQLVTELGFVPGEDRFEVDMQPFLRHDFDFFNLTGDEFSKTLDTCTREENHPRTLFACHNTTDSPVGSRTVSVNGIMTKGLGVLGCEQGITAVEYQRCISQPRILILGTGVSAYLLALTLRHVYGVPKSRITITGRTNTKLLQFKALADQRVNVTRSNDVDDLAADLVAGGPSGGREFDCVFECVGGGALRTNVRLAIKVLAHRGTLGLFGISDDPVDIDFTTVMKKELFLKGSYRASLKTYQQALRIITSSAPIRASLDGLVDATTTIRGNTKIHPIQDAEHLREVFQAAATHAREHTGRIMIGTLDSAITAGIDAPNPNHPRIQDARWRKPRRPTPRALS